MKKAREVQAQAAADARYDVDVGREEGFRSPFQGPSDFVLAVGLLVLVLFVWLAVRNTMRGLYTFVILLGFAALFLIHKKAFDP